MSHRVDHISEAAQRWPGFATACADHGVLSTLSLPMVVADMAIGAMNLYAHAARGFGADDEERSAAAAAATTIVDIAKRIIEQAANVPVAAVRRAPTGPRKVHGVRSRSALDRPERSSPGEVRLRWRGRCGCCR